MHSKRRCILQKPLNSLKFNGLPRFSTQLIGINKLSTYIKSMFSYAGISTEGRNITNHSGKVTLCTSLYNSGYEEQTVQNRSGHRSTDAVRRYKRPGSELLQSVSDCLQPPKPVESKSKKLSFEQPNPESDATMSTPTASTPTERTPFERTPTMRTPTARSTPIEKTTTITPTTMN